MARILAIDYGMKRTGLAVTDPSGAIAFGLTALLTRDLFAFLKDYLGREDVGGLVVGEPKRLDGTATHGTAPVEAFIRKFTAAYPQIPVYRVDERFTSSIAQQAIRDSGIKKMDRRNKLLVDEVSAVVILQSWIEQNEIEGKRKL